MTLELIALKTAQIYSDDKIKTLRKELTHAISSPSICIVTVGSFARREASQQSDLDFFVITEDKLPKPQNEIEIFINKVKDLDIKMPAVSGAFNELEQCSEMIKNIGGFGDVTEKLTRRLLFLLEGEWLYNQLFFDRLFDQFINIYVKDSITEHQLARFLLNDLIRYYRTICVDFEYKTSEDGKPWGDRNIKLMFSRKLLYFSGVLVAAETIQNSCQIKREILKKYLRLTPIERTKQICGPRSGKALAMYNDFLEQMALPSTRDILKRTTMDRDHHPEEFRSLKNKGHHFTYELSRLLSETYDSSHPIHNAMKF